MASATNPAITGTAGGAWEIAFQGANTTDLYLYNPSSESNTSEGMLAGTSPSIVALATGGHQVAFQANTQQLFVYGTAGLADANIAMDPATSPSITALAAGGYEVAFQAKPVPVTPVVSTPIPPPPPTAHGKPALRVKVLIRWKWNRGHSRIVKFIVGRHPHDMTLRMRCQGHGCPTRRTRFARPGRLKRFIRAVLGTRYAVGDGILFTVSASRYRTERAQITIRASRKPAVRLL